MKSLTEKLPCACVLVLGSVQWSEQIGTPGTLLDQGLRPLLKSFPPVEQAVKIPTLLRPPPQTLSDLQYPTLVPGNIFFFFMFPMESSEKKLYKFWNPHF